MKPSNHVHDKVDDLVHGLLRSQEANHVEAHCMVCPECREALTQARQRLTLLQSAPVHEPSRDLVERTLKHIDTKEAQKRRFRRRVLFGYIGTAVAAVLLLGLLTFLNETRKPSSPNLQVLGQGELIAGSQASLRVRLTNQRTGAPLANVPVKIRLAPQGDSERQTEWDFTTDEHGTLVSHFDVPDWGDGTYDLRITAKTAEGEESITKAVNLKRAEKVMLSSDKPIYQPGQTIHLRALALRRSTLKPVAHQPAVFTIRDPKNNIIFKKTVPTSAFGIASVDCPLATEINEGAYTIDVDAGTTKTSQRVEVFKYVLPKFKVEAKLDKPYYQPGDKVKASVEASYFFGKPVAGGKVELLATLGNTGGAGVPIAKVKLTLDAEGKADTELELPQAAPFNEGLLDLRWEVVDTANQKQTSNTHCTITRQPLHLAVLPENGVLVPNVTNKVYLLTTLVDGKPAPAQIAIANNATLQTNDLGVAIFEVNPGRAASFVLGATVRANNGMHLQEFLSLPVGQASDDFVLRTDKAVYTGGDRMTLTVLGSGTEPMFVDILKEGHTLHTAVVDVQDGQGTLGMDLSPEWGGTLQIYAYRINASAQAVRKVRTVYVRPAETLQIKFTQDKAVYRPGENAQLKVSLVDKQGKPVVGAVSLTGVDEAVYSVNSGGTGLERTFYLLEQELLKPVWAIYPWSPDAPRTEGREQLEQAVFSLTTQQVYNPQPQRSSRENARVRRSETTQKGVSNPHTLTGETFQTKQQQHQHDKAKDGQTLKRIWLGYGLSLLIGGYVVLWLVASRAWIIGVHVVLAVPGVAVIMFIPIYAINSRLTASREEVTFQSVSDSISGSEERARSESLRASEAAMEARFRETSATTGIPSDPEGSPLNIPWSPDGRILTSGKMPASGDAPTPRLREWFPETLLWQPELVTDADGNLVVPVKLADSITTWRITASAVTQTGDLGATRHDVRVFQPFFVDLNLPVCMTRNDEVTVPVTVYNYLKEKQTVKLKLETNDWFELLDETEKAVELKSGEVVSVGYRIRVKKVGDHTLQVSAFAGNVADAIKRKIEVVPDGYKIEVVHNGTLQNPVELPLSLPNDAIEGSPRVIIKVYPGSFSQLVEGMENIFQMPYGCFEQTSSTTYPNVLALDYLKATGKRNPEVEAKAKQYIHLGYQRLLGFEVKHGGFDWYGRGPANELLTAYGLLEFQDMARVHEVDPDLIRRTRLWLLDRRDRDGSWTTASKDRHFRGAGNSAYAVTAYIAWSVFYDGAAHDVSEQTRRYLLSVPADRISDPYVLAITCNALLAIDPKGSDVNAYLDRLDALRRASQDGKKVWWEQDQNSETMFHGRGTSGSVETTGLAVLARIKAKRDAGLTRGALTWLVEQKDGRGTWHSTQATVYALKSLIAGTTNLGGEKERQFEVSLGNMKESLQVAADQAEVLQQLDLTPGLKPGTQTLRLKETSDTAATYQVVYRYHVPKQEAKEKEPLSVDLAYDRSELRVNETLKVTATVRNNRSAAAPMVMLDLPIPAGFKITSEDLAKLVEKGTIDRYQITARRAIVYLRQVERGTPLVLEYRLQATMPAKLSVPGAHVYEYYDPKQESRSPATSLTVKQ